jgi:hypothetical protein
MKNLLPVVLIGMVVILSSYQQTTAQVFYNGRETPEGINVWTGGFSTDPIQVDNAGYTPGTAAMRWATATGGYEWQWMYFESDIGFDLTSIWETDSVYFKIKAPGGVDPADTLTVWLYEPTNTSYWDNSVFYDLPNYPVLQDGNCHQFSVALKDFQVFTYEIDTSNIVAVSLETDNFGLISEELIIDDIWIGNPDIHGTMTIFNGKTVVPQITTEVWGFQNNSLVVSEGEGYEPGTNAIVWENCTGSSYWDAGLGFIFAPQQFNYAFTTDTFKIKVKAPSGINDLALVFWDQSYGVAVKIIDNVVWDGEWKILEFPLADFIQDAYIDLNDIYYFSIGPASAPIPERILFDDIWIGNPFIDFTPPPAPTNLIVAADTYLNTIFWDNTSSENGETYDVYASMEPITDLNGNGVFPIARSVEESQDPTQNTTHRLFYPLEDGAVSYYYAVSCTDAAGNESEIFTATPEATMNTGKKRAVISLTAPNFTADGNLSEWNNIEPFNLYPEAGRIEGQIDDENDYSALCYVAIDNENLYVAFDVIDDVFSYRPDNTQSWWEDESIEFFFGFYELNPDHISWQRGDEPDYRVVFKPYEIELLENGVIANNTENYFFEPLGESDYVLEAKIPFSDLLIEGDAAFTPVEGMTIPFEIFAADADVVNEGNEGRLQFGYNPALNPWGEGPGVWTFAWIGMPLFTDVENYEDETITSYELFNNYPNPFNPTTHIKYQLPESGHVSLKVFDVLGREVMELVDGQQAAGSYNVNFDALDLASGIYIYRLKAGSYVSIKKMMLLK